MKVAALGIESFYGEFQRNLKTTISWIEKLSDQGVKFILFPELNLSAYSKDRVYIEQIQDYKESAFERLKLISMKYEIAFAVGFPEKHQDNFFISHFIFDKGMLVGVHRKTHLSPTERECYTEGNEIKIFDIRGVKIGIQLCYESHFPEMSSIQASMGAQLLAFGFASPKENAIDKSERFKRYLSARAYDNSCFVMACNLHSITRQNVGIPGLAMILDPKGKLIRETYDNDCLVCEELDLEEILRIKNSKMGWFKNFSRHELFYKYYKNE